MTEKESVFVLMPFNKEQNALYNEHIKPTCEDHGYEVQKADTTATQQNIVRDIITGIRDADLLIADLTGGNPNVFYEVGVADTMGIPTLLITQNIDDAKFDLQSYNMTEYSVEIAEVIEFAEELDELMGQIRAGEMEFGNPVTDFTELTISPPGASDSKNANTGDADEESEEPEKGVFDYASEAQSKQADFMDSVSKIISETDALQQNIMGHTAQIEAVTEEEGEVSPTRANRLARKAASDMKEYGQEISQEVDSVEEGLQATMKAEDSFIEFADPDIDEHETALRERQSGLREFRDETEGAIEGLEAFYYQTSELKGISRQLNQGVNELSAPLSDLISTLTDGQAEAERMIQRIEQKLSE